MTAGFGAESAETLEIDAECRGVMGDVADYQGLAQERLPSRPQACHSGRMRERRSVKGGAGELQCRDGGAVVLLLAGALKV